MGYHIRNKKIKKIFYPRSIIITKSQKNQVNALK